MPADRFDWAVCIGRFQLFHDAQLALLHEALGLAPRVAVVIGSAYQARSPRNPFSYEERVQAITLALSQDERERVSFLPLRDVWDEERWVRSVQDALARLAGSPRARIVLVGHRKDPTSEYLDAFPGWTLHDVGRQGEVHGKALRAALYAAPDIEPALAAIAGQVPATTLAFLRSWAQLPFLPRLRGEWAELEQEHAKWAMAPYPPVFVTVDAVVRVADQVLLIRRGRAPGKGLLAVPGGFIEQRETAYQSAVRELQEETGFELLPTEMQHALKAVRVFDHPDRSQRGRVITHAFHFDFGERMLPEIAGSDDAAEARWVPIAELPSLEEQFHDDHFHILDCFLGLT
ncbi:bifunctional nicotinamide-nucleotide adenylyltransferase/Nudix hydroxylase [Ramlibacter ginsenosidimutans]|uniref:Bifunctional nicotinamide-nucleotide adenylyltransferase/Nudix hydroxylase n=1 Tax=Ramlibacter ginsenosidimutans TaxID=502333 RepID=A0A934TXA6_9BURK|nr:bifunctional nicotinamide-nucleotide adenylyltransferase/Nudix hydroxylase [Ramlibacter ginsenosidimutans]MBK6009218.1 bifunctional nicotinamide-nucleotide adenylyltransferase/Nudix hydroxylase [Ramlibacter ginsenosidimutans]